MVLNSPIGRRDDPQMESSTSVCTAWWGLDSLFVFEGLMAYRVLMMRVYERTEEGRLVQCSCTPVFPPAC